MPKFKYSAKGIDGKNTSGVVDAANRQEALAVLRGQNLVVLNLYEGTSVYTKSVPAVTKKRRSLATVKTMDMVLFTRQMATMISAGIPLLEALDIMVEQMDNPAFKQALASVSEGVRTGDDFSTALGKFPRIFPLIYVNMVRAGEASGQLDIILVRLAEYQEANAKLIREIKSAMTYPVIAMILVLSITTFLMVYIVPKFKEIFDSLDLELPLITKIVLGISLTMRDHFVYVAAGGAAVAVAAVLYVRKSQLGRRQWDWLKLSIPVFGPLFSKVALSRFSRTFSTLIASGVPMLAALEIVSGTAGNVLMSEVINHARDNVRQGETLSGPLSQSSLFPPMVTRMISVGEKTGALEQLLEKISEFYDQQVEATVDALTSIIEPLLIAFMGVLVGVIVLSIFLPIIKIQQTVAGAGG